VTALLTKCHSLSVGPKDVSHPGAACGPLGITTHPPEPLLTEPRHCQISPFGELPCRHLFVLFSVLQCLYDAILDMQDLARDPPVLTADHHCHPPESLVSPSLDLARDPPNHQENSPARGMLHQWNSLLSIVGTSENVKPSAGRASMNDTLGPSTAPPRGHGGGSTRNKAARVLSTAPGAILPHK
jgi:hypothetical protein